MKRVVAYPLILSGNEWWWWKSETWHWYDCCNEWIGKAGDGCVERWTCCKRPRSNEDCALPQNQRWSCCDKTWVSEGCENITDSKKLYNCCKKPKGGKGCEMIYDCCRRSGEGCTWFHPCCEQAPRSRGCKLGCMNCT